MRQSDRKTVLALALAIALSVAFLIVLTSLPSDGDDDRPTVTLFDKDGNEYTGPILDGYRVGVSTYYEDGVLRYIVDEGTELRTDGVYLKVHYSTDASVSVGIPGLSGWLASAGIVVTLFTDDALQVPYSQTTLDGDNRTGIFDNPLESDVSYYIGMSTASEYSSEVRPGAITLNDIIFKISTSASTVRFVSDGDVVETRVLEDHDMLGALPSVTKYGYTFEGWYSGTLRVSETTLVSELPSLTIEAEWSGSGPSPPTPPEVWPKIFEEDEYDGNKHIHTTTILEKDGFRKIIITITYTDSDDLERYVRYCYTSGKVEELSMIGRGDRIEIEIPEMTPRYIHEAEESISDLIYNIVIITTPSVGRVIMPIPALGTLDALGYWASVHNGGMYAIIDNDAVKYLNSLRKDSAFSIVIPTSFTLTPEQAETIGDRFAADVKLSSGGDLISDFHGRSEVGVQPGYRAGGVYLVDEDGTKHPLDFRYDSKTGTVVFEPDHFSVYMIDRVKDSSDCCCWLWILAIIAAAALIIFIIVLAKRRRRE